MKIILGSSSKFRQQVMRDNGYDFEVISPDVDEKRIKEIDPIKLVLILAHVKADSIIKKITEPSLIITADQVVTFKGQIREKPSSSNEARKFLQSYGVEPSETINGIVVTNSQTNKQAEASDVVKVYLNQIPNEIIEQLITEGIIFHCAGALRLEDPLMKPYIKEIRGSKDSLMGLPIGLTEELIQNVL